MNDKFELLTYFGTKSTVLQCDCIRQGLKKCFATEANIRVTDEYLPDPPPSKVFHKSLQKKKILFEPEVNRCVTLKVL